MNNQPNNFRPGSDPTFPTLVRFLAALFWRKSVLFKNKTLDRLFIAVAVIVVIANSVLFGKVLDYLVSHSGNSTPANFIIGIASFWGIMMLIKGIFPSLHPVTFLNNTMYGLTAPQRYTLSLFRQLYTFTTLLMLLSYIVLFSVSSSFSLADLLFSISTILIAFHLNRLIKTILLSQFVPAHSYYMVTVLVSALLITLFKGSIYWVLASLILCFVAGGYSYQRIMAPWRTGKKERKPIVSNYFLWRAFFRNPAVSGTMFLVVAVKLVFLTILSTKAGTAITGRYYLFILFALPILPFTYLYNNLFGFIKEWYRNSYLSPTHIANACTLYLLPLGIVALLDFSISCLLLQAINVYRAYLSFMISFSLPQFAGVYLLCLLSLIPAGIASSMFRPRKISGEFLKKNNTSMMANVASIIICVLAVVVLLNFRPLYVLVLVFLLFCAWFWLVRAMKHQHSGAPLTI